jgi:hypothetical protein
MYAVVYTGKTNQRGNQIIGHGHDRIKLTQYHRDQKRTGGMAGGKAEFIGRPDKRFDVGDELERPDTPNFTFQIVIDCQIDRKCDESRGKKFPPNLEIENENEKAKERIGIAIP